MFYSVDLLALRGGQMNLIWRLGIMKEQEMIVRKNKARLLKSHLVEICQSLISRFPAMGKESSFSLL